MHTRNVNFQVKGVGNFPKLHLNYNFEKNEFKFLGVGKSIGGRWVGMGSSGCVGIFLRIFLELSVNFRRIPETLT